MNILGYQSFETKGDRFQKYKQSKSVFDSEDKSYQNSGGEEETQPDKAINKSSSGEDDQQESSAEENGQRQIFDESDQSKEQLFEALNFLLKNQKPRQLIKFDQNLFKSFNFDKAENNKQQEINESDMVKQNNLKDKILKFQNQKLSYQDYFDICDYSFIIQEEDEANPYYDDQLKRIEEWVDYIYPNPNGSKNKKVTTQMLDIIPKIFTEDDLTFTRIFINQESTYIYKKQKDFGFQMLKYYNKDIKQSIKTKDKEEQDSEISDEYIVLEIQETFNIILPDELNLTLKDLDIGFIQNARKRIEDTIEDQFVIIQTYNYVKIGEQVLLIYSLKDTSKPVVKYTKGEFYKSRYAFFTRKDEETISFIIMSGYASSYYVIDYKESEGLVCADKDIYSVQNDPRIVQEQNYSVYLGRLYDMHIQPLQITVTLSQSENFVQSYFINYLGKVMLIYPYQEKLQRQKVIEFIQNKHKINGEDKVYCLYFNDEINYLNIQKENDEILQFLENAGSKHSNINSQRIFTEDLAIIMSCQGVIETLTFNQEQADCLKAEKIENYENRNKKQKLLSEVLVQFDCLLQHEVYQHNYALYTASTVNQYINGFYINKNLKGVFSTHNQFFVGNNLYKFNQNTLILDLSSVNGIKEENQLKMLELYSEYEPCKNLKLVKYFVTQKSAVFFFLYRKDLTGFYFMIAINLKDLDSRDYIVKEDSEIIYFENNKNIMIEQFNNATITTYQAGEKYPNFTKQQFIFEIVKDNAEPTQQYIPFILHSRIAKEMFDHYFCWMDADKLCQAKPQQDSKSLNFGDFIASFKIDYYQKLDEPVQFDQCTQENAGMRMDVISKGRKSQNMFTRSSNWTIDQQTNKIVARYMVANNIKAGGIESIEIKEFFVNLDFKDMSKIDIKPIQMKYLTFNEDYINSVKSSQDNNNPIENNRLVPKIDDDGNINGVLALLSNQQYLFGIHKIISDTEYLSRLHKDQENILKLLIEQASQFIFIQQAGDTFEGYLQDGTFIKGLKWEILTQEGRKFVPSHVYYAFDITDHEDDFSQLNSIQNDIVHMNVKKNQFGYLTTIKLSQKSINNKYFDNKEAYYWLYQFAKTALSSRLSLGFDYLFEDSNDINYQILQPQYKLNGQNQLFQILQDINIPKVEELFELIQTKDLNFTYLKNSALYFSQDRKQKNPLQRFTNSMEISHNYELKSDMLNLTSIIQTLYQYNKSKELKYLIKQIIQTKGQQNFSRILIYELPCLMMNQYEIHDFMDIDKEEEQIASKVQSNNNEIQHLCNLEIILKPDQQIKDFGQQQIFCSEPKKLENIYLTKDEILKLIKEFKQTETKQNKQVEYSYIDFTYFCRQMNIIKIQGKLHEVIEDENLLYLFENEEILQCSQLFLSSLINFYQNDPVMFQQNTVQALIDSQFQTTTKPIVKKMMFTYLFGFVIPFAYNIISDNLIYYRDNAKDESNLHLSFRIFNYLLASFTSILFSYFEIIEIKFSGLQEYFSSGYNVFDFSQPLIYLLHIIVNVIIQPQDYGTLKVADNFIQILIIVGAFSRMLQFIRYKEQYCIFVNIFNKVLEELQAFIIAFFVFTLVFGFVIILMQADVDNQDDDYKGMSILFESFLQVFRTSLGDLKIIKYNNWEKNNPNGYYLALIIIWLSWIFNLLVMQIIMLNLVIAQVGQTFEKVMSQGKSSIYIERASLNQQILQILFHFGQKKHFLSLVLQKPSDTSDSKADEFTTFSERIIKSTRKQIESLQKKITQVIGNKILDLKMNKSGDFSKSEFDKQILSIKNQFSNEINAQKMNIISMKDELKEEIEIIKNDNQNMLQILKSIQESLHP